MITLLNVDSNQYIPVVSATQSQLTRNKTLPRIEAAAARARLNAPFFECNCDKCGAKGTLTVYGTYENKRFDSQVDAELQNEPPHILKLRYEKCSHKPSVFPYDGRPFSSVSISVMLVGIFGTIKESDSSLVQETPVEDGAESEAQTDTKASTPEEKVDLGNGFWFDGKEVHSSKGPLGKLGLDKTNEEWDFPLSISTICRLKQNFKDQFEFVESTLVRLGLCSSEEPLSLKDAIRLILSDLKKFLKEFLTLHNMPFLSGASFGGGRFFWGYGYAKI